MTFHGPGPGPGSAGFPRPFGSKYTLLSHLAVGGMADVFLAQYQGPAGFEKECVIKRILPHLGLDQGFVQMFLDEARIAARLSHPNIAQIFELGQEGGDYFLAMEYIDGVNLEQALEEAQRRGAKALPWPIAVRIIADVAAGLDYAHNVRDGAGRPLQLVHRDVSPSNVMVAWGGAAKILDFGIAKAVIRSIKRSKTEVGTVKGKIPYMSPEQLQGLPLDGRSDIFSLGVILYEATCGVRPFPAETPAQLTMQILHEAPRAPDQIVPDYPLSLKPILGRALAKDPQVRFQTAREFKLALEQLLAAQQHPCSTYDVEAYLRELFPEGQRPRRAPRISGMEQTEASQPAVRVATPMPAAAPPIDRAARLSGAPPNAPELPRARERIMSGDKREGDPKLGSVTGLHMNSGPAADMEDLPGRLEDLEAEESRPRRGGGGLVTAAIVIVVLGTAVGFYFLRSNVLKKEAEQAHAVPPPPTLGPDRQAPPPPEARPEPVKEPPRVEAPKPPVKEAQEPPKAARSPERPKHLTHTEHAPPPLPLPKPPPVSGDD